MTIPAKPSEQLPRRRAERHEALFHKLQPLARSVSTSARSRPGAVVPDSLRIAAEAVLFEAEAFRSGSARGALPLAAPHFGALNGQLSEALGMLIAFETANSAWNGALGVTLWQVAGPAMPVQRLAPRAGSRAAVQVQAKVVAHEAARAAAMVDLRAKLVRRLDQFYRREAPDLSPSPDTLL